MFRRLLDFAIVAAAFLALMLLVPHVRACNYGGGGAVGVPAFNLMGGYGGYGANFVQPLAFPQYGVGVQPFVQYGGAFVQPQAFYGAPFRRGFGFDGRRGFGFRRPLGVGGVGGVGVRVGGLGIGIGGGW